MDDYTILVLGTPKDDIWDVRNTHKKKKDGKRKNKTK